jgi:hypothetical protein
MKAKKAVKRLARVEALLAGVLDQFSDGKQALRKLLDSAKGSVARAKEEIHLQTAPSAEKKAPVQAKAVTRRRRISAAGRKRISVAAKKRWAAAKRKGVHAITGQRLSKTA